MVFKLQNNRVRRTYLGGRRIAHAAFAEGGDLVFEMENDYE